MKTFKFIRSLTIFAILSFVTVFTNVYAGLDYTLVKDIETADFGGSNPQLLTDVSGTLYFTTNHDDRYYLWKSDGTKAGTVRVPLTDDLLIYNMINVNGTLYMSVRNYDNNSYYELWKSDGTEEGTVRVYSFDDNVYANQPGYVIVEAGLWTVAGDSLYFFMNNIWSGSYELWKTDGSEQGTELIYVWNNNFNISGFRYFVSTGDRIYFRVRQNDVWVPTYGYVSDESQLWTSDGVTTEKVFGGHERLVGDIGTSIREIFPVGSKVYFRFSGSYDDLWVSDGTPEGTDMVDISLNNHHLGHLTDVNGTLFYMTYHKDFWGELKIWKLNNDIPVLVNAFDENYQIPWWIPVGEGNADALTAVGSNAYFFLYSNHSDGIELWITNGSLSGTKLVQHENISIIFGTEAVGNTFFFTNFVNEELWKSNGTAASTTLLHLSDDDNVLAGHPVASATSIRDLVASGSKLFFVDWDTEFNTEVFVSNGTEAGTFLLINGTGTESATPEMITNVNGTAYFVIGGDQLWKSDGTEAGTVEIPIDPNLNIRALIDVNGVLFVSAFNAPVSQHQLWKTNTSATGLLLVQSFEDIDYDSAPGQIDSDRLWAVIGNTLFFLIEYDDNNLDPDLRVRRYELWKSDGTSTTSLTAFSDADYLDTGFESFVSTGSRVFFNAFNDTTGDYELWTSDGTAPAKVDTATSSLDKLTPVGNMLYYVEDTAGADPLYVTDGTTVTEITDLDTDILGGDLDELTNVNGTLFFAVDGWQLGKVVNAEAEWVTEIDSGLWNLTAVNDKLFFFTGNTLAPAPVASDSDESTGTVALDDASAVDEPPVSHTHNVDTPDYELWVSDGTTAGTVSIEYLFGADPDDATAVGNHLYFTFWDDDHGRELWRSDGSAYGTVLAKDINPGYKSSGINELTDVDGTLFLSADDGLHGDELWKSYNTTVTDDDDGTWYDENLRVDNDGCAMGGTNPVNLILLALVVVFTAIASRCRRETSE